MYIYMFIKKANPTYYMHFYTVYILLLKPTYHTCKVYLLHGKHIFPMHTVH